MPKWFVQEEDATTGSVIHQYTGEYWQCKERQDWSRCPDIYLWTFALLCSLCCLDDSLASFLRAMTCCAVSSRCHWWRRSMPFIHSCRLLFIVCRPLLCIYFVVFICVNSTFFTGWPLVWKPKNVGQFDSCLKNVSELT